MNELVLVGVGHDHSSPSNSEVANHSSPIALPPAEEASPAHESPPHRETSPGGDDGEEPAE
ncbi:hypothetical protein Dimus_030229, partial [Dionaea muscipula]